MEKSIALIGIPESRFIHEVAACLGDTRFSCHLLSLDAPQEGKPVTIAAGAPVWEGIDLLGCGAVFLERAVFSWPQTPLPAEGDRSDLPHAQWVGFRREAAALAGSALLVAADRVRVVNPPAAAPMAASLSIALESLAGCGLPVHPWTLEPAPPRGRSGAGIVLDSCGLDRWHTPLRPEEGGNALVLEPFPGGAKVFLVIGGKCAGAIGFTDGESWARWHDAEDSGESVRPEPIADPESVAGAADLARRSARALGLDFAAVSISTDSQQLSVLLCEASPDLAVWNGLLGGRAAAAIAEYLESIVSTD